MSDSSENCIPIEDDRTINLGWSWVKVVDSDSMFSRFSGELNLKFEAGGGYALYHTKCLHISETELYWVRRHDWAPPSGVYVLESVLGLFHLDGNPWRYSQCGLELAETSSLDSKLEVWRIGLVFDHCRRPALLISSPETHLYSRENQTLFNPRVFTKSFSHNIMVNGAGDGELARLEFEITDSEIKPISECTLSKENEDTFKLDLSPGYDCNKPTETSNQLHRLLDTVPKGQALLRLCRAHKVNIYSVVSYRDYVQAFSESNSICIHHTERFMSDLTNLVFKLTRSLRSIDQNFIGLSSPARNADPSCVKTKARIHSKTIDGITFGLLVLVELGEKRKEIDAEKYAVENGLGELFHCLPANGVKPNMDIVMEIYSEGFEEYPPFLKPYLGVDDWLSN